MSFLKTKFIAGIVIATIVGGVAVYAFESANGQLKSSSELLVNASSVGSDKPRQLWTCGMHPQVIQDHPGNCFICHMKLTPLKDDSANHAKEIVGGERKILYYWDPMLGPSSIAHEPGMSAMGMKLVPVYEDEQSGGPTVKIDPTIVQNMGVRTAEVTRGPLAVTIRAVGMLEVPESSVYEVNLKINGWIQKLYANSEGMHIGKGEPLFDLYSPDVQVAADELIGAQKALNSLDIKTADIVRTQSQRMVDSTKKKLRLWGISDPDIEAIAKADKAPATVTFRSPVDGDIVEKMVVEGSAVQAGMKLLRIEDHARLWLIAQVYEDQISALSMGQVINATVDSVPGKTFSGPIIFMHPHIDHMTRTVSVRVLLENTDHALHPGMYATANITTKQFADAVMVPREAVIDTGTRQIAFVAQAQGHFDPRIVRMGIMGDGDKVQILEGLAPGEVVVTSGQFLMDVESRTTEAIDKLRHASTPLVQTDQMPDAATIPAPASMPVAATQSVMAANVIAIVHCPMKNADWLQIGNSISNPYFGSSMASCGSITREMTAPAAGSPLDDIVTDYLLAAKAFDDDKLNGDAIAALQASANKLANDNYSTLKRSIASLAGEKDLGAARSAFQSVSAELIRVMETVSK